MTTWEFCGSRFVFGEVVSPPPTPDNDNWRLMPDWKTPAEFLQWVRRTREEMRRELAADFSLRHCPTHRRHWDVLNAMERCCLWHRYGVR
jgi:hypothetical protein